MFCVGSVGSIASNRGRKCLFGYQEQFLVLSRGMRRLAFISSDSEALRSPDRAILARNIHEISRVCLSLVDTLYEDEEADEADEADEERRTEMFTKLRRLLHVLMSFSDAALNNHRWTDRLCLPSLSDFDILTNENASPVEAKEPFPITGIAESSSSGSTTQQACPPLADVPIGDPITQIASEATKPTTMKTINKQSERKRN